VSYENPASPGVRLAGTLTVPSWLEPHPAVVLISGFGPHGRDGNPLFRVLTEELSRNGIAVLRYDDRGVGGSSGNHAAATMADLAADAEAGFEFLRRRPDVDPRLIGLVGHGEGGLLAAMAAARNPEVAFPMLLASPALPGREVTAARFAALDRAKDIPEAEAARRAQLDQRLFEAILAAKDVEAARAPVRAILTETGRYSPEEIDRQVEDLASAWMRSFLTYDPQKTLRQIRRPALALFGGRDLGVNAAANVQAMRDGLTGSPEPVVLELDELNHLFQRVKAGEPQSAAEAIDPAAVERIWRWVFAHIRPRRL
jgi:pimeloyl-ACP methyl ester carboxylesterase